MTDRSDQPALPISLFDYELPEELIAQHPLDDRAASRLLVLNRGTDSIEHSVFRNIADWLLPGDLLVINDTRVFPARLRAKRQTGGQIELLLLNQISSENWRAMARPARRLRPAETLTLLDSTGEASDFSARVLEKSPDGTLEVEIPSSSVVVESLGQVPLPHYITEELQDRERYQTVFAEKTGSVAAPTAGLHFTDELLSDLEDYGVEITRVTLHVGPGTFQPVKVEDASQHVMHSERYEVSFGALRSIRQAVREGRRVVAVGTTSCRTLESIAERLDEPGPLIGETRLYITPGYSFKIVGALLTNFHLPKSTLLLLVSAFAGREPVLRSYREAVEQGYRFYSFGDAMFIV